MPEFDRSHRERVDPNQFRTTGALPRPPRERGYAAGGQPVAPDDRSCLARVVNHEGREHFYVRRSGTADRFFDPELDVPERLNATNDVTGRAEWVWAKVTDEIFDLYVQFLHDGNPARRRAAERAAR